MCLFYGTYIEKHTHTHTHTHTNTLQEHVLHTVLSHTSLQRLGQAEEESTALLADVDVDQVRVCVCVCV